MIPSKWMAGDTLSWTNCSTTDYLGNEISSTEGWALSYFLRKSGAAADDVIEVEGEDGDDGGWEFIIDADIAAEIVAGTYAWAARATKTTSTITIATGQSVVTPNINEDASFDGRSQAKQDLEAVQTAMRAIISGGAVAEYTINGRSLRKIPMEDLIKLESKLKNEVIREERADKIAQGLGDPKNLFVRFRR